MLHALVLEHDPQVAAIIRNAFETRGPYRVTTAADAHLALNVLADDRPGLVVVDETLPDTAGWEFARHAAHLRVPVLMLIASDVSAMRLRRAGCPYVPRPFHIEFLLQETRRLLRENDALRAKTTQLLDRLLENKTELAGTIAAVARSMPAPNGHAGASAQRPPSLWRSFKLQVVPVPQGGRIIQAPPVITVRSNSNHYLCGKCGTLLMIAEHDHVQGLVLHCRACNAHNESHA